MKKSLIALAVVASLTTLSGCGSSSSSDASTDSSSAVTTLSGTAAKGIIQYGIVTATELSSTGELLAVVGTATTDESGHYDLELTDSYQGGVVKLTLSAGENTTMKCDVTDGCGSGSFGDSIPLTAGFSLDAIVQPEDNVETVSVQITPLTHMATARALAADELNATSVADAISEVSAIAGENIMSTEVVDITDPAALLAASDEAKELAIFNAGLADVLVEGTGNLQENLTANLEKLASTFEDGQFDADDEIAITAITEAVEETASTIVAAVKEANPDSDYLEQIESSLQVAVKDVQLAVDVIKEQIVTESTPTESTSTYDPEPSESAQLTPVEQAKALLTDARTFIGTIVEDFEDPLDALEVDAKKTVAQVMDTDTAVMSELLGVAVEQTLTYLDGQNIDIFAVLESTTPTQYQVSITDESGDEIGTMTVTLTSDVSGIAITLNGSLSGKETVTITDLKLATNITADALTTSIDSETQETLLTAITATSAQVKLTGSVANSTIDTSLTLNDVALTLSATEAVMIDTTEEGDDSALESKISGASFVGDLTIAANGASFNGAAEIVLVGFGNSAAEVPLSLQKIAVKGTFTSTTEGSFTAGAKLVIDNATSFDTLGYLDYESTAYAYVDLQPYSLNSADAVKVQEAASNVGANIDTGFDVYYSSYDNLYKVGYNDSLNNYYTTFNLLDNLSGLEADIAAEVAKQFTETPETTTIEWLDYHSSYSYASANVKVTFPDFESAENFVKGTLTISSAANLPELPEASVVASVSRTEIAGGDANLVVNYNNKQFTVSVDSEDLDADEPKATLTLTNPDGVKVTINLVETVDGDKEVIGGTVFVAGTQVGTIDVTDSGIPLVRYSVSDNVNYFESLY